MLVECVFLDIKLIADVTRCIGLTHNAPHKQIRMFSIKFNVMGYGQGSICWNIELKEERYEKEKTVVVDTHICIPMHTFASWFVQL